jgi:predicted transposase/invertase (TIGR01784 family)
MKFVDIKNDIAFRTDKWTYFIKNAENLKMIPDYVDEEGLLTAFQEADKHNWKKEELIAYDNASMRIQDARGEKELAHEQGIEQGIEQGLEQKEKEAVVGLHENGVPVSIIALSLKIPESKVNQIISDYNKA